MTGASDGIGAAAARRLHRAGAQVVVVGRSAEKTAAVAGELGVPGCVADFGRLDDVRRLAADLRDRYPRIDVLANNAGASFGGPRRLTGDGVERTFQVDHLAPYLLTRLLEEPLRAVGGRVVTTSSFAHWGGGPRRGGLAAAADPGIAPGLRAYCTAKWANVLFTRELARRWAPDVTATSFDPGAVATSFGRSGGLIGLAFRSPLIAFARTPGQAADTLVWLATADDGWRTGGHHRDRHRTPVAPTARDDVRARELWELSARLVGLPA
ncbi:SDR family NAD(P)-dependent oxidoreductase [Modestobacter sp. NPDC049651]|uniref:SDR family NAD(P)-dependent oxidoreductase n=1 Tax=unclassified Modestobacter TaxID=2643866 RepID=UPI0033DE991A